MTSAEISTTIEHDRFNALVEAIKRASALVAPILAAPLTRLLPWSFPRWAGATAILVRESAPASRGRTAATAILVMLTVGIALSLLTATSAVQAALDHSARAGISADYAISPTGTPGLSQAVVQRLRTIEGVQLVAPTMTTICVADEDRLDENNALVVDAAALGIMITLDGLTGSTEDLRDDSMVTPSSWGYEVDEGVTVLMGRRL